MKTIFNPRFFGGFLSRAGWVWLLCCGLLFFSSCEEPDGIGLGLIETYASFSSTDTLTIKVFSGPAKPIPTNFSSSNLLGVINDPVFGKSKSGIFTEFRLPQNNFSLGENVLLDSVVLSLGYSGRYYGQPETFQRILVYELAEQFPEKDTLFSDMSLAYHPVPIGEMLLRPAPLDSVAIDTIMYAPHFTIRLNDEFGRKILAANGTDAFRDIPSFLEYFSGLYIVPDDGIDGVGSIFNINMFSGFTRLSLFYKEFGQDTPLRYNFMINEFARRSSHFQSLGREQAHPLLVEQLNSETPSQAGDSLLFVQAMGQVRGNITFPHITALRQLSRITINQARLILNVAEGFEDERFPEPGRLILYKLDQHGNINFLADHMIGEEYFGGTLNKETKMYRFNITSHFQRLLDGQEEDYGMVLVVSGSADGADRVVLKGPGASRNPMRLEIIYTLFN